MTVRLVRTAFVIALLLGPLGIAPVGSLEIGIGIGILVDQSVLRVQRVAHDHAGRSQTLRGAGLRLEGALSARHQNVIPLEAAEARVGIEHAAGGISRGIAVIRRTFRLVAQIDIGIGGQYQSMGRMGGIEIAFHVFQMIGFFASPARERFVRGPFGSHGWRFAKVAFGGFDAEEKALFDGSFGGEGGDEMDVDEGGGEGGVGCWCGGRQQRRRGG
mmetsp:Transcript_3976/g.7398  ORF Transcript_3976/g.7398 Transcript_3976/m.7398 type:complete len:216 (+) Transcript_3976:327-974(+)